MCRYIERGLAACVLLACFSAVARAQAQGDSKIDALEDRVEGIEERLIGLQGEQQRTQGEIDLSFDEMDEQILDISKGMSGIKPGKRKFLLTGYAFGGFESVEAEDSTFFGGFVPIFLWQLSDRIFLEAEVEFELEGGETAVELEYAQMSYVISDFMILGVGKFLNPANPFAERLHPAWINKLPDAPLGLGPKRIMPFTQLGMQLHGGVPVGSQKLNYAVYVSNGPTLEVEEETYGALEDENFTDTNNNKAVGGRIGYFPLPELELGYSLEFAQVTPSGSGVADADAMIQSVDLNYTGSVAKGTVDMRAQWAFSDLDNVVFDPAGTDAFGPVSLNNERNGGYVQAAYRPSDVESPVLSQLEGVVRYDQVDLPSGAPEGADESRVTIGLNYWIGASSVFKVAYQFNDADDPVEESDAVLFQWAIGF